MSTSTLPPAKEAEASEIRVQVEYYFSDHNLPSDRFLLERTGGWENKPVPITAIHTFKKMQKFQPYSFVVNALRESAFLDVTENECVRRKVPLARPEQESGSETEEKAQKPSQAASKKLKKGMSAPTGFEEYFTDPPVSAEVFREEEQLYSSDRSFTERIETAIRRYEARRKFHSEQRDVFHKWMKFGGIDMSPKQYSGGLDARYLEGHTKAEIADMTAISYVGDDKEDVGNPGSRWTVDFEGVTKGFLSSFYPYSFHLRTEAQIKMGTNIIRNFFNYLLHHNICPEYNDQIKAARKVCDVAEKELFCVEQVSSKLPGDFNIACSTLYGGSYQNVYAGDKEWAKDTPVSLGMSKKDALAVTMVGIAALATEQQVNAINGRDPHRTRSESVALEVTGFELADAETQAFYKMQSQGDVRPLGRLFCKTWRAPDLNSYDRLAHARRELPKTEKYTFFVEEDILKFCFVGMKLEATVKTLNIGVTYLDEISAVYCSFYTYLSNELMRGWKEVEFLSEKESKKMERTERNEAPDVINLAAAAA